MTVIYISTTPSLEGHRITAYHDIVFGEVIVGTDFISDFFAGFTETFGGRSTEYEGPLLEARQEAVKEMKLRAAEMGANAVVGVDIDYESFGQMLMVIASGTAVTVEAVL